MSSGKVDELAHNELRQRAIVDASQPFDSSAERRVELGEEPVRGAAPQLVLGLEVVVEQRLPNPCACCDLPRRCTLEGELGEELECCVEGAFPRGVRRRTGGAAPSRPRSRPAARTGWRCAAPGSRRRRARAPAPSMMVPPGGMSAEPLGVFMRQPPWRVRQGERS